MGVVTLWSDQKAQIQDIEDLEKDLTSLTEKYETTSEDINKLDKDFNISKTEVIKDLEYIKERLNLITN